MKSQMLIETVYVRVRACVCVHVREWNGVRRPTRENCILMHNYYCIYKDLPRNINFVPTYPADASHFVTPSIVFT